jgi:hypothetical protein
VLDHGPLLSVHEVRRTAHRLPTAASGIIDRFSESSYTILRHDVKLLLRGAVIVIVGGSMVAADLATNYQ